MHATTIQWLRLWRTLLVINANEQVDSNAYGLPGLLLEVVDDTREL